MSIAFSLLRYKFGSLCSSVTHRGDWDERHDGIHRSGNITARYSPAAHSQKQNSVLVSILKLQNSHLSKNYLSRNRFSIRYQHHGINSDRRICSKTSDYLYYLSSDLLLGHTCRSDHYRKPKSHLQHSPNLFCLVAR